MNDEYFVIDNSDQQIVDQFIIEMNFQGFHAWQCPYCYSALWLEGEPLMLMRYGTIHIDECQACREGIKEVAEHGV